MTTRRLIETWLPIAALGVESTRERTPMTPFPAPNRLHVWWARRPLVAARAAVLASLLPADADRQKFLRAVGIHGDPVAAKTRIAKATREGVRLGAGAYGYPRAFSHTPDSRDREWILSETARLGVLSPLVLDPTAGGGSIPFEAVRLGFDAFANDLNPVACFILRATVEWPLRHGARLQKRYDELANVFVERVRRRLRPYYPEELTPDARPDGYLWSRTIPCPFCNGVIPLSPNWRLAPNGTGVQLNPDITTRTCSFEIVHKTAHHSPGKVTDGDVRCPYGDCGRIVEGAEVKRLAQADQMGEKMFAVVFKKRIVKSTKNGKGRVAWERGYRAPSAQDDMSALVGAALAENMQSGRPAASFRPTLCP